MDTVPLPHIQHCDLTHPARRNGVPAERPAHYSHGHRNKEQRHAGYPAQPLFFSLFKISVDHINGAEDQIIYGKLIHFRLCRQQNAPAEADCTTGKADHILPEQPCISRVHSLPEYPTQPPDAEPARPAPIAAGMSGITMRLRKTEYGGISK